MSFTWYMCVYHANNLSDLRLFYSPLTFSLVFKFSISLFFSFFPSYVHACSYSFPSIHGVRWLMSIQCSTGSYAIVSLKLDIDALTLMVRFCQEPSNVQVITWTDNSYNAREYIYYTGLANCKDNNIIAGRTSACLIPYVFRYGNEEQRWYNVPPFSNC